MRIIEARLKHGTHTIAMATGDSVRRALSQLSDDREMHGVAATDVPHQLTVEFTTRPFEEE